MVFYLLMYSDDEIFLVESVEFWNMVRTCLEFDGFYPFAVLEVIYCSF